MLLALKLFQGGECQNMGENKVKGFWNNGYLLWQCCFTKEGVCVTREAFKAEKQYKNKLLFTFYTWCSMKKSSTSLILSIPG